jgi:ketosteroid isomerase-like protein
VLAALQDLSWALATADGAALDTLTAEDLTVFRDGRLTRDASSALEAGGALEGGAAVGRRLLFRDLSIEIADGQMAWVTARYTLQASDPQGTALEKGLATLIFERTEGIWRLAHMHFSASAQPGAEAAPDAAR